MIHLKLQRPLVIFDLETTGVNFSRDRIIDMFMIRVMPDQTEERRYYRFNPGVPIPPESTAIHGIRDEDVREAPFFKDKASEIHHWFADCDFAGFNSNRFDFPMLVEEFLRCGISLDYEKRKFVDAMRIFHAMEPRDLSAAYRFYCNKELTDAHNAAADTEATWEILCAQLNRYPQLEPTVEHLQKISGQDDRADLAGRMVYGADGEVYFNFGKHKGKKVKQVMRDEPSYYEWMMNGEFSLQTKQVLTRIRLSLRSDQA
jgi:DNA polymerase-3 subunit epsilon